MAVTKSKVSNLPAWVEAAAPKKNTQTTDDPKQTLAANLLTLGDCETPEQQKALVFSMLGPDYLDHLSPALNRVLLITYVWSQRRRIRNQAGEVVGHLDLPTQTLNSNRFEGKTGLVIAMGETAFKYFDREGNPIVDRKRPSIGDWVWYRASDAAERGYGMTTANMLWGRTIADIDIEGKVTDPRMIF